MNNSSLNNILIILSFILLILVYILEAPYLYLVLIAALAIDFVVLIKLHQEKHATERPASDRSYLNEKTFSLINEAVNLRSADPKFKDNLQDIRLFLTELAHKGYQVRPFILKNLNEALEIYMDINDDLVKTDETFLLINKIHERIKIIRESLRKIFDEVINNQKENLEYTNKALKQKLEMDNLL